MNAYNYDNDYATPYHWYMSPDDLTHGGIEYWQYIRMVEKLLQPLPKNTILDIGCGDGRISDYIACSYPDSRILGIDISEKAIAFAKLMGKYAEYRCVDLFDITEKYDVVLLIEVLEHIPKPLVNAFLKKVYDVMDAKGSLLLSVPTPLLPMAHPGHIQHFNINLLSNNLMNAGLEIKELRYHLNVKLSRYSCFGRNIIRLFENRFWSFKLGLGLLRWIHNHYICQATQQNAGRIVVRAIHSRD